MCTNITDVVSFQTAEEFFLHIAPWGDGFNSNGFIFRGHSKEEYELTPSALRPLFRDELKKIALVQYEAQWDNIVQSLAEIQLLKLFYQVADRRGLEVPVSEILRMDIANDFPVNSITNLMEDENKMWPSKDLYEAIGLAQHYGIPTRFLDWTYNINTAIFFACEGAIDNCTDGDNISVWALNKQEILNLQTSGVELAIDFIQPHYHRNPNISAQSGLFTIIHEPDILSAYPLDKYLSTNLEVDCKNNILVEFRLPKSEVKNAMRILNEMKCNHSTVYPGYYGVSKFVINSHKF